MSNLHEKIKADVKDALKAKDEVGLRTARSILAAFTNELVKLKQKPSDELSDEQALEVIKRLAKQRKDSIEQFRTGEREDLAVKEEEELACLEKYLPETMGKEEIKKIAEAKKETLGITEKSDMGKLIGAVMGELKGKADGGDVKDVVNNLFEE